MVNIWLILIMMLFCQTATAKDLGVHGQIFTIKERDILQVIKSKLTGMELNHKLAAEQQKILTKTYNFLHNPVGFHLPRCSVTRSYNYDPSFYWPTDLRDHNGRLFYKAFTKVDPLAEIPATNRSWILFDGNDDSQIDWIKQRGVSSAKLIVVNGSAIKLMKELEVPVYFDFQAKIVTKLAIRALPAIISLKQKQVTITEVAMES